MNQFNSNTANNSTIGSMQAGPDSVAEVSQSIGTDSGEIAQLLLSLRQQALELPEEQRFQASTMVDAIEGEVVKENPNRAVVDAFYNALPALLKSAPAIVDLYMKVFGSTP